MPKGNPPLKASTCRVSIASPDDMAVGRLATTGAVHERNAQHPAAEAVVRPVKLETHAVPIATLRHDAIVRIGRFPRHTIDAHDWLLEVAELEGSMNDRAGVTGRCSETTPKSGRFWSLRRFPTLPPTSF